MRRRFNGVKALIIVVCIFYVGYVFVVQQIEYNKYINEKEYYTEQIKIAKAKTDEYKKRSDYVKSDAYIEQVAREKLGMILPEEKIYIEINK